MKTISLLFFLLISCISFHIQAEIERRGAFDVGSSSIKLLVADVDTETQQIVKYIYGDSVKVPFGTSLASNPDGLFGEELQKQAKNAIVTLMKRSESFQPKRFVGVAAEAFRSAKNGQQLAAAIENELNVPIYIIPQVEEGELGFESAIAHSKGNPDNAVVWDLGGGSFQISWKDLNEIHSYSGKLGRVPTKNIIIAIQNKALTETTSPNPISEKDAALAKIALTKRLQAIPENLQKKLQNPLTQVYGIGAVHHANIGVSTGESSYSLPMVEKLLMSRLGLEDSYFGDFTTSQFWVSDLVFVSSVMSYLGIENVLDVQSFDVPNIPVGGNTVGILIKTKYWNIEMK